MTAVVWFNLYPDTVTARGMWDSAMLDALFDHSLWRPVGAHTFEHYEHPNSPPAGEGAVVVVSGRYHDRPGDVTALESFLRSLPWVLLIVTADEAHQFPIEMVRHDNMRAWLQTPDPARPAHQSAFGFGVGWPPHARACLAEVEHLAMTRPLDAFFAGQVTHTRRQECVTALDGAWASEVESIQTAGFTQGVDHETYFRGLARAKAAPCPSGPQTVDSFRVWEALEAGCVPLADTRTPDRYEESYWSMLFDRPSPFPLVHKWAELPEMIRQVEADWPAVGNRVFAWWQQYKRRLSYRLRDDICGLSSWVSHREIESPPLADWVTVIVPTSPIPSHPDTAVIDETLASVRDQLGPDVEIVVMIDGVRGEQQDRRGPYEEYTQRLLWSLNRQPNIVPMLFPWHHHQAAMTRVALAEVKTPLLLFVEHDTPLIGDIPWQDLAQAILTGEADVVRFHHEASILKPHRSLMLDTAPRPLHGDALGLRTVQWSQRPHLASVAYYRHLLETHFSAEARTMIEDVMYGVVVQAWNEFGEQGWHRHRLWLYAPPEGSMVRSRHLDGRAGDPKFDHLYTQ